MRARAVLGRDRSSHSTRSRARKSHKRSSMGVLPIRETAGADAVTSGLAVAEGEKWCCAAACVKVHGAPQCTAAVFEVRTAFRAFPTAHIRFPTLDCPSDVCVTDDTHSTPLAIPHPTHHPTPLHRRALLAARPRRIPGGIRRGRGWFAFVAVLAVVAVVERGSRWQRQK